PRAPSGRAAQLHRSGVAHAKALTCTGWDSYETAVHIDRSDAASRAGPLHEALWRGEANRNPAAIGFWALLREDRATHGGDWLADGFWALAVHRFGNWRMDVRPRALRAPLSLAYKILERRVRRSCGITLPYTVRVGRRVRIWHHGGMVLHARSI